MWDVHRLPRAEDKTILVTGANAGIGYFVAEQLAGSGAEVVLGSRNPAKAEAALTALRERVPGARVRFLRLDLADLGSLPAAAAGLDRLDVLVCNAGVFPEGADRHETAAGHELAFGTNHLGHFALIHHLLPLLAAAPQGRVVTTGSFTARSARLDPEDWQTTRDYQPMRAYARSKLAQMVCAFELDRRLRAEGSTTLSLVNHPGGALDPLTPSRPPVHQRTTGRTLLAQPARVLVQGKDAGAWPAVRAALDPAAEGGQLWGPRAFGLSGQPRLERVREHWSDPGVAARLWAASAKLAGVS
ncbi:NAD(P)-dependent dehydrogenase (short-subunit alcohol dehydrogenase family) [Crossiella equi]|uniref:NAD(P)-dependent dehydrogenase (Short-subunit alcohol dehydrogenase family) n=1 Tax=Crossiella equi TaxID=130796 RepID=A0ABS5AIY6_9PSEU|nr:SDR family NAD(P)-dependent oxidoreductase [Crossiella equi]MBP2476542.1 NAD(P)-dependent dehydrogenase (short-subunit alcohol dehydrogenase family) [Crossiella equi]